ncbi:hypothetical protein IW262DRAFT_1291250 [Armillaria fumosa]|nr:hypothetical protein IW262DRAFT_1291250 [Armillaria fumosa]
MDLKELPLAMDTGMWDCLGFDASLPHSAVTRGRICSSFGASSDYNDKVLSSFKYSTDEVQRSYMGNEVIPSVLANTLCANLGVNGVLEELNAMLGTSRMLNSIILKVLNFYIAQNVDFGTAYAYLHPYWYCIHTIKQKLSTWKEKDKEMRQNVLADGRITKWGVPPQQDCKNEMTPINGCEWPVPMPKDANLDLIRIEMLNLGVYYVWLDILCLRQAGGKNEHLHLEEWKLVYLRETNCHNIGNKKHVHMQQESEDDVEELPVCTS